METSLPRPLTVRERDVLAAVVGRTAQRFPDLAIEVAGVSVAGTCDCGCPTISFDHGDEGQGIELVADVAVRGTNDAVLLYVSESGHLASLEYLWTGDSIPSEFPSPEELGSDNL